MKVDLDARISNITTVSYRDLMTLSPYTRAGIFNKNVPTDIPVLIDEGEHLSRTGRRIHCDGLHLYYYVVLLKEKEYKLNYYSPAHMGYPLPTEPDTPWEEVLAGTKDYYYWTDWDVYQEWLAFQDRLKARIEHFDNVCRYWNFWWMMIGRL